MLERVGEVRFPEFSGQMVNMMPVVMGAPETVPDALHGYLPMLDMCRFAPGAVAFMTVSESWVEEGGIQRRGGVHTDGTSNFGWGGGGWGGRLSAFGGKPIPTFGGRPVPGAFGGGIYMASTDGDCRGWDSETHDVDHHGQLLGSPLGELCEMDAAVMYCMSDRTPHQAVPSAGGHRRQFFRMAGPEVSIWWAQHNTPNPRCPVPEHITVPTHSKFAEAEKEVTRA